MTDSADPSWSWPTSNDEDEGGGGAVARLEDEDEIQFASESAYYGSEQEEERPLLDEVSVVVY